MLDAMQIKLAKSKVVFLRVSPETYEKLNALRAQAGGRGVATVVTLIVEAALKEGVTILRTVRSRRASASAMPMVKLKSR